MTRLITQNAYCRKFAVFILIASWNEFGLAHSKGINQRERRRRRFLSAVARDVWLHTRMSQDFGRSRSGRKTKKMRVRRGVVKDRRVNKRAYASEGCEYF